MIVVAVQVAYGILLALFTVALLTKRKFAWRWFSGCTVDGQRHTNATWLMPSHGDRPVLHPTGYAIHWHHIPRLHRAGIRTGGTVAAYATYAGLIFATTVTVTILAVLVAAGVVDLVWRAARQMRRYRRYRTWERPARRAIAKQIGTVPAKLEISYNEAGRPIGAGIGFGEEYVPGDRDRDNLIRVVTTKLAIEAPAVDWSKLHGKKPEVTFRPCGQPPPSRVSWNDVVAAIESAAANALVFGLGKRDAIIKAAFSESPHIAIPGPSGGGKSNLAAFLLLQEMLRGSLIFNLDPKWISHLWLQGLPNVINAHDIPDLHLTLVWLGKELLRRTKAAYASAGGTGRVRGNVGPRIIVVCEELNYGMPGLKDHWREIREKDEPKRSPALAALSALSCAGRASDMHELLIAQMLTAESTGVNDSTVRSNAGIKAMVRPDTPGWNMVVGKHIPMPPQTTAAGRIQLVSGQVVRETQVPYLHLDDKDEAVADKAVAWARELAVSGAVAKIPIGGEYGVPLKLVPPCVLGEPKTERLAITAGPGPETLGTVPDDVPDATLISLREACDEGTLKNDGAENGLVAARKAAQRPGFPAIAGWASDGKTALYFRADLAKYREGKVRTLRKRQEGRAS